MFVGLQRLIANNYKFTISQRTKENLNKAASDNCNIVDFVNEALMIKSNASIASVDLYDAYLQWCVDNALDEIKREAFIRWLIATRINIILSILIILVETAIVCAASPEFR